MEKYKNCPVCHTINPPNAQNCSECGYRFGDEPALTDDELKRMERKKKRASALMSCVIFVILASLIAATMIKGPAFGGLVILIWLGVLIVAVAAVYVVSKIVKHNDIQKQKRDRR